MKKIRKKVLSVAASLALTAGCLTDVQALFPNSVLTADAVVCGVCGSGLSDSYKMIWTLENGVLTISGEGSMKHFDPGEEPWASYKMDIRRVVIEEGVTGIGAFAFWCYGSLTEVSIPQSVTDIGNAAFDGTPWMKAQQKKNPFVSVNGILINGESCKGNVTVPGNITSITENAFYDNKELKKITIPDGVTSIGGMTFSDCTELTDVRLSANLNSIGNFAFSECSSLKNVTIPDSVASIGSNAFMDCSSLEEITIPASVHEISHGAFRDCAALQSITILDPDCDIANFPETICNQNRLNMFSPEYTGVIRGYENSTAQAYAETHKYTFVSLGQAPTEPSSSEDTITWKLEDGVLTVSGNGPMEDYFMYDDVPWYSERDKITRIVLGEGITRIGNNAFTDLSALRAIKIPEHVKEIGDFAFYRCGLLTTVYLSDGTESIGEYAFYDCKQLKVVRIPESVTKIGYLAFKNTLWLSDRQKEDPLVIVNNIVVNGELCKGDLTIPDGVTCITGAAFYRADSLESVTLPDSVKEIGYRAFDGCYYMKKIKMPNTMTYLGGSAFYGCASLQVIRVPEGLTSIESSTFCNAKKLRAVSMPKTLTKIESDAFSNCESLTLMAIPDNVQYIGNGVFEGCTNLKGVTVPETLKSIGEKAFFGCTSFTNFDIPANTTEIGGMAFRGTPWLAERQKVSLMVAVNGILIDGSGCQGSVTIPTSVDIIGEGAFEKCSEVTRVIIPKTTSEIRSRAFADCESLEEIIILNPICRIYTREDTVFTKWEPEFIFDGQIRGYQDSTAEIFAKALDYSFLTIPKSQRGDYNGDRFFSISDAVLLARFSVQDSRLVSEQISHILNGEPDYDRDGFVTVNDLTALLKNLSKLKP